MKRMQDITGLIILILLSSFPSCRDEGTGPPPPPPPGRRDYTWTVDTIKANPGDQIYLFSLWGSSPSDVWAVGHADASDLSKWHFDGTKWQRDSSRLSSNLESVFGFAQNDVWACDAPGGNILHYDGVHWNLFGHYALPGFYSLALNNIWGKSPNDIYAVGGADSLTGNGYKGIIMHYDGASWRFINIQNIKIGFSWIKRDNSTGGNFVMGTRFEPTGDSVKIFTFRDQALSQIYVGTDGSLSFNSIDERVFFTDSRRILLFSDTSFSVLHDFSNANVRLGFLYGRGDKDIIAGGTLDGKRGVLQFNGTDVQMIYETPLSIFSMLLLPKDVFILAHDSAYPIIIHGVLR